jgi:hypothetical protein
MVPFGMICGMIHTKWYHDGSHPPLGLTTQPLDYKLEKQNIAGGTESAKLVP